MSEFTFTPTTGVGVTTVGITTTENYGPNVKEYTATVSTATETAQFTVKQLYQPYMDADDITVQSGEQTLIIGVNSLYLWTLQVPSWVTWDGGISDPYEGVVIIKVQPNSGEEREGTVKLLIKKNDWIEVDHFKVTQEEGEDGLIMEPNPVQVKWDATSFSFDIITNKEWYIRTAGGWITSTDSGSGSKRVTLTCTPNTGTSPKAGIIGIYYDDTHLPGRATQLFEPYATDSINADSVAQSYTITYGNPLDWTLAEISDWVTVYKDGSQVSQYESFPPYKGSFEVRVEDNPSVPRVGRIVFRSNFEGEVIDITVIIHQQ